MDLLAKIDSVLSARLVLPAESGWRQPVGLVAHLGDGLYMTGGLVLVYMAGWFWSAAHLRQAALSVTLAILAAVAVVTLIKLIIRRERPQPPGEFVALRYDVYSFPSGHSARLAALAMGVVFFFPQVGLLLWLLAIGVAVARVAVGIHYLGDIIIGLGIGALVAWQVMPLLP